VPRARRRRADLIGLSPSFRHPRDSRREPLTISAAAGGRRSGDQRVGWEVVRLHHGSCAVLPMTRPRRVGLPWYEPNQYAELRSNLADGTKLPPDYETWRVATE
jgi:hypothetical protein